MIGQILSQKRLLELTGQPREKDRYLINRLGINERDIRGIFSSSVKIRVLEDRVVSPSAEIDSLYQAAEILGKRDPKFITEMNLAALIFSDWDDPESNKKRIHYQLQKLYRAERKEFLAEFGFKLPYIEFLKEEVTGRKLNCLKAREQYKKFRVSTEDILRNIALPDLNYESAVLLGVYRGRGILNLKESNGKKSYVLQLSGNSKGDFDFYEDYVKEAIQRAHNLKVEIRPVRRVGKLSGKEYEAFYPQIQTGSKMIYTWLKDDLGFPQFHNIKWNRELEQGFFDGLVASMGALRKDGTMVLTERNREFIKNFVDLSIRLGFTPQLYFLDTKLEGKKYRSSKITFSQREVKRMNLINPKHC